MVDGDRIYPVQYGFLHHSTGPSFKNASDLEVRDWYSAVGKDRAYQGGAINPRHEHPDRPGQLSYAQAQYTLREYTLDGNKYGWRATDLIVKPMANVAWAVGNWWYNQRSFSIEICGNFLNQILPDKALMLLADEIFRPVDKELVAAGYPDGVYAMLHFEVYATACPGRIREQRDKLVDMINNPDKWNKLLWPPAPPKPVITTKDFTETTPIPFTTETIEDNTIPKGERRIKQEGVEGSRTVTTRVTYSDGKETKREVVLDKTIPAVKEIILAGTHEAIDYPKENNRLLNILVELVKQIIDKLTSVFK